jgi:outer membrane protein TolC
VSNRQTNIFINQNQLPEQDQSIIGSQLTINIMCMFILTLVVLLLSTGCSAQRKASLEYEPICDTCSDVYQQIETPVLDDCGCDGACDGCGSDPLLVSLPPVTISNFHDQEAWELTVDECVHTALSSSKVMQKLGGVVTSSPAAVTTLYDQAINETSNGSVEAALSAFDTQLTSGLFFNHSERAFNNVFFGGGVPALTTDAATFQTDLQKTTAAGTRFTLRNQIDYNRNNSPVNQFGSAYDWLNLVEVRQPLWRGAGTAVNRIAGPNAVTGVYNGVLISRVRSDISLADFERSVRDLIRDVERSYWELYFAYHDLHTRLEARDAAREVWENRKLRFENGIGRPDDEAQARQQYFTFQAQSETALTGTTIGQPGVLGAERTMRRLLGLAPVDGRLIRPTSDPAIAPVVLDWDQSQEIALDRRVEIRRQQWSVKQRELELFASRKLNQWQLDFVGQYGFRGFGDNLFGSRDRPNGSAFDNLINGDLDDWQLGVELGGAIGNRRGHVAIRNAELNLAREKTILKEQKRQLLHDLNAAFVEVDRSMAAIRTSYNSNVAVQEELIPKRKRVDAGQDEVFFLLDTQQRATSAASNVHRAIANYNLALIEYDFACGRLLQRHGISLEEGPWDRESIENSVRRAPHYVARGPNVCDRDLAPISAGPEVSR